MIKKVIIVVVLVVVCVFAYYAISPLFRTITINEEAPATIQESEELIQNTAVYLAPVIGTPAHPATGTIALLDTTEGKVLRYENYKTINGPDLFVYVSTDTEASDFVSLGEIKGTEGNINYTLPEGIDLSKYRYVLTWCKQFGVLFNYADLGVLEQKAQEKKKMMEDDMDTQKTPKEATALFGNGCFWCVEQDLAKVRGVKNVVSGYAGGAAANPSYENYYASGHREVVEVTYDPHIVSYANLVEHIIKHGDPTDGEGSFYDRGEQYAPAIYYSNEEEKQEAESVIATANALAVFDKPLALDVLPRTVFYAAEAYHQDYAEKNPLKYNYFRTASGRSKFIEKMWGEGLDTFTFSTVPKKEMQGQLKPFTSSSWLHYMKPNNDELKAKLTPLQYEVTQEGGTEPAFHNEYDKNYAPGIYVDIVSGEPLYFSKDKYDSRSGWPSFVKPISNDVVTIHEDNKLFTTRSEVRSKHADSHLGHVFDDGPENRGGKRYCMNSAAMRFIPKEKMEEEGYGYLLSQI
jgi:peptide methionine sulfoxide reductase msrA/msrB